MTKRMIVVMMTVVLWAASAFTPATAFGEVVWNGYTVDTDQVGGTPADGIHDGIFNYDYADTFGLGSVKHYMELAQDAQQVGVDGSGNPLYEYIIVQYVQAKTGWNLRQFFFGMDSDKITNTYDLSAENGPGWENVPMEYYMTTGFGVVGMEPAALPEWYGGWTANPDVPWGYDFPDDLGLYFQDAAATMTHLVPFPAMKAGESIDTLFLFGGYTDVITAPEDMFFFAPVLDILGVDSTGWWTIQRIVSTQRLENGDLTWSEENMDVRQPVLGNFFPVPEPATLSLLALGACLPVFHRKRR